MTCVCDTCLSAYLSKLICRHMHASLSAITAAHLKQSALTLTARSMDGWIDRGRQSPVLMDEGSQCESGCVSVFEDAV